MASAPIYATLPEQERMDLRLIENRSIALRWIASRVRGEHALGSYPSNRDYHVPTLHPAAIRISLIPGHGNATVVRLDGFCTTCEQNLNQTSWAPTYIHQDGLLPWNKEKGVYEGAERIRTLKWRDTRLLPDGSRRVEAVALQRLCQILSEV